MTRRTTTRGGSRAAALCVLALLVALALGVPAAASAQDAAAAQAPRIQAPSAILVEPVTGDVVFQRNADQRRPIASTTKLMTALLTIETLSLDDVLAAVDYPASSVESLAGFRAGEKLTVRDYLRALLVQSANDAAATLATRIAGSRAKFVDEMNARAKTLGLKDTRYANPVGLDQKGGYSSAADLVKLTLVLRRSAFFRETTNLRSVTLRSGSVTRTFRNRNRLVLSDSIVNGVKTGHTRGAGYVLVGSATRAGVTMLSAVLGDPSESARDADTIKLLRYGLGRYEVQDALTKGQAVSSVRLAYRQDRVDLVAARTARDLVRSGTRLTSTVVGLPTELDGPVAQGTRIATVVVRRGTTVVAEVPLVTARPVAAASAAQRLTHVVEKPATIGAIVVFVIGSLGLVLLRRRAVRRRRAPVRGTTPA